MKLQRTFPSILELFLTKQAFEFSIDREFKKLQKIGYF